MVRIHFNDLKEETLDKVIYVIFSYKIQGIINRIFFEYKIWNNLISKLNLNLLKYTPENIKYYIRKSITELEETSGFSLHTTEDTHTKVCTEYVYYIRLELLEVAELYVPIEYNEKIYNLYYRNTDLRDQRLIKNLIDLINDLKIDGETNYHDYPQPLIAVLKKNKQLLTYSVYKISINFILKEVDIFII